MKQSISYLYYYYIKDYQGNIRQVTDADGNVLQDNHYYPYGMLMAESSDILAANRRSAPLLNPTNTVIGSFNPYLFGGKEYIPFKGSNYLDFSARIYDNTTITFGTPDKLREKYYPIHSRMYCAGNPVMFIDPSGYSVFDAILGTAAAIVDNALGGNTKIRDYAAGMVSDSSDFNNGLDFGNSATLAIAAGEVTAGACITNVGEAEVAVGVSALGPSYGTTLVITTSGVIKTVGGVALSGHGIMMSKAGGKNKSQKKGHINNNKKRTQRPNKKLWVSKDKNRYRLDAEVQTDSQSLHLHDGDDKYYYNRRHKKFFKKIRRMEKPQFRLQIK